MINIQLSKDEIILLMQALNEICNGPDAIEPWEFSSRMGATREEATILWEKLNTSQAV